MTLSWNRAALAGLVALFVATLSAGCSDDKPSGTDAGPAVTDSGSPPADDGGSPDGSDAGPVDAGGNPGIGETGSTCHADSDCASLICLLPAGVCSLPCEGANNCPNSSWQCGNDGSRTGICICVKTEGGDDICDGVDNDCNGVIDDPEAAVCPGQRVCVKGECACASEDTCGTECVDKQTNPKHCGDCDQACDEGWVCQQANCVPND